MVLEWRRSVLRRLRSAAAFLALAARTPSLSACPIECGAPEQGTAPVAEGGADSAAAVRRSEDGGLTASAISVQLWTNPVCTDYRLLSEGVIPLVKAQLPNVSVKVLPKSTGEFKDGRFAFHIGWDERMWPELCALKEAGVLPMAVPSSAKGLLPALDMMACHMKGLNALSAGSESAEAAIAKRCIHEAGLDARRKSIPKAAYCKDGGVSARTPGHFGKPSLLGTWKYYAPGTQYPRYLYHVKREGDGELHYVEYGPDGHEDEFKDKPVHGVLKEQGPWHEAELVRKGKPWGTIRITQLTPEIVTSQFKPAGRQSWQQNVTGVKLAWWGNPRAMMWPSTPRMDPPFTLSARIKTKGAKGGGMQVIAGWGTGSEYANPVGSYDRDLEFRLAADSNLEYEETLPYGTSRVAASPKLSLADGEWHHVAAVRLPHGEVTLYADGAQVGHGKTATSARSVMMSLVRLAYSERHYQSLHDGTFEGHVGPFRIYQKALSLEELNSVMSVPCDAEGIAVCDGFSLMMDERLYLNSFKAAPPAKDTIYLNGYPLKCTSNPMRCTHIYLKEGEAAELPSPGDLVHVARSLLTSGAIASSRLFAEHTYGGASAAVPSAGPLARRGWAALPVKVQGLALLAAVVGLLAGVSGWWRRWRRPRRHDGRQLLPTEEESDDRQLLPAEES